MRTVQEIIDHLESLAPSGAAESWDNVGLLVGDPSWKTKGAIVSIDLTADAIQAALKKKFKLIVTHHPCIFPKGKGPSRINAGPVFDALRAGIAVAAYHTNFDQCALEVVEHVSQGLKAQPMGRLVDEPHGSLLKLSVFVPITHAESVRAAICEAGAGHIGHYDFCTFATPGEGTFRGGNLTKPFLGKPGILEKANEIRLETVFPKGMEKKILSALFKAHPYEEVAFDLYCLRQSPSAVGLVRGLGYGFWGKFPSPRPFSEVIKDVKSLFNIDGFWLTDPPPARIKKVAFVAGKGASFVEVAAAQGCELFITGEAGYHTALDGMRRGMAVMELGHRESERFFLSTMKGWLSSAKLRAIELNKPTQRIRH